MKLGYGINTLFSGILYNDSKFKKRGVFYNNTIHKESNVCLETKTEGKIIEPFNSFVVMVY